MLTYNYDVEKMIINFILVCKGKVSIFFTQAENQLFHDPTVSRKSVDKDDDDDELLQLAENGQSTSALGGRLG